MTQITLVPAGVNSYVERFKSERLRIPMRKLLRTLLRWLAQREKKVDTLVRKVKATKQT